MINTGLQVLHSDLFMQYSIYQDHFTQKTQWWKGLVPNNNMHTHTYRHVYKHLPLDWCGSPVLTWCLIGVESCPLCYCHYCSHRNVCKSPDCLTIRYFEHWTSYSSNDLSIMSGGELFFWFAERLPKSHNCQHMMAISLFQWVNILRILWCRTCFPLLQTPLHKSSERLASVPWSFSSSHWSRQLAGRLFSCRWTIQ